MSESRVLEHAAGGPETHPGSAGPLTCGHLRNGWLSDDVTSGQCLVALSGQAPLAAQRRDRARLGTATASGFIAERPFWGRSGCVATT